MTSEASRASDPRDSAGWTTILSPDALAKTLAGLGDSATAYWAARSDDDLRLEMRSSRRSDFPIRYQIARSALAARGIEEA